MSPSKKSGGSSAEPQPGGNTENGNQAGRSRIIVAINSNLEALKKVLDGLEGIFRIVAYICFIIALLAIIVLLTPPYQQTKSLIALGFTILALIGVAFVLLSGNRGGTATTNVSSTTAKPQTLRLTELISQGIRTTLEEARINVYNFLKKKIGQLADKHIRANVFFPVYDNSGGNDDYVLRIYPGLHLKMDQNAERQIQFGPNQGLVGLVFASAQGSVAQRGSGPSSEKWDRDYDITQDLEKVIHPELKWVLSMPLKKDDGTAIGVLNVDGLCHQFDIDTLYECLRVLTPSAIIAGRMAVGN
jgi:hypothetical protein